MLEHGFAKNYAVRMAGTPGTWAAAAVYGEWIAITGFRRITFLVANGELDGDMAFKVYEATDSSGTSATEIDTDLRNTFTNGTDEARVGIIEVRDGDLTDGYPYVALQVTPGATDTFAAVAILSEPYEAPVSNATTDGVAFADAL